MRHSGSLADRPDRIAREVLTAMGQMGYPSGCGLAG